MKLRWPFFCGAGSVVFIGVSLLAADIQSPKPVVTTPPVYVPSLSHASGPLSDATLAWGATTQETNAAADAANAHFTFSFTNVSADPVVILGVRPSCGCTTAQVPSLPWDIPAGASEKFGVTVNLEGKSGTLYKTVDVSTDKGSKMLTLRITILPPVMPKLSAADRARGVKMAKADRQAVFHNACATCHVKRGEDKYGEALYQADCAICHEGEHRATMVPDLHALKTPTNQDFWRTWISYGKPGTLMPAFATSQGGPLTDMQIASLAAYLNEAIPSHAATAQ
jgi:mono/diheme cytochrome c family protein